jgi:hypothetical protein
MGSSSWARVPALPAPAPPAQPEPAPELQFCCPEAWRLFAFGQRLYDRLIELPEQPTTLQVEKAVSQSNDALLRFSLRWFAIRSSAPQPHKHRLRATDGAPCIHAVYLAWFERILSYQQEIKPPPLAIAPKSPAPPRPRQEAKDDGWLADLAERIEQAEL